MGNGETGELTATTLLRERLQHSLLIEQYKCRIEELEQMLDDEHHRVLALSAEITARNAANRELRAESGKERRTQSGNSFVSVVNNSADESPNGK